MKEFFKAKWIYILCIVVFTITLVIFIIVTDNKDRIYVNDNFEVTFDSTWKKIDDNGELVLEHKESNGKIKIYSMILDDKMIGVSLKDILSDLLYSIEKQNIDYKLISSKECDSLYDAYQLLYESEDEQTLVNIYKLDNKIIFALYNDSNEYFDIILDSVDEIFKNIKINVGVK